MQQSTAATAAFRPHAARQGLEFAVQTFRADVANFFMLHYRHADGFLVTGKNSGTHWLKYMLSCALAHDWGVEPPSQTSGPEGDTIIGNPRRAPKYPDKPRIGSSHTIPSGAFALPLLRASLLRVRPAVVLVRDIREAMLSNYLKWNYGVPFTDYVEGKPGGKKYVADAWWYVHFFNRWGDIARAQPDRVMVVRYEDVRAQPEFWLRRVGQHYGFNLTEAALAKALAFVDRDAMRQRQGSGMDSRVVSDDAARARMRFGDEDLRILSDIFRRHLRHDFGYGYLPGRTEVPPGSEPVSLV